jgi:hypothetical protein
MTEWLPFLHPVWQSVGIALGFMAWRKGLALRRGRRAQVQATPHGAQRSGHVRLGKCCLWLIGSGYLLGLGELCFGWGAVYGFALLRSGSTPMERRDLHAFLMPLALLMMVGVGVLGLQLLP